MRRVIKVMLITLFCFTSSVSNSAQVVNDDTPCADLALETAQYVSVVYGINFYEAFFYAMDKCIEDRYLN